MPGVSQNQVPAFAKTAASMVIGMAVVIGGLRAPVPDNMTEVIIMVGAEYLIGFIFGFIPAILLAGVMVAGQVTTGAIGLGQANMIDPSLGANVSVLSRLQSLVGAGVFLLINGHHACIKASANFFGTIEVGEFRPGYEMAMLLLEKFSYAFELAVSVSAPILITVLVTQFVLGLITKFVQQVNIFIISLPVGLIVGLFITIFTLNGLTEFLIDDFLELPDFFHQITKLK